MSIDRAVILATPIAHDRPWSSVGTGPKPLASVATRPVLFHVLDALRASGVREAALVTDRDSIASFRSAVAEDGEWDGLSVTYAAAEPGSGACGALQAAGAFCEGEPVLVHQADAVLASTLQDVIAGFGRDGIDGLGLHVPAAAAADPREQEPACWLFSARAVNTLLEGPSVPEPLLRLRGVGAQVRSRQVEGCLACHGAESSLLRANRHILGRLSSDYDERSLERSEIQGPVVIHPSASVRRSLVRGPAIIGEGATVTDSYVGPYTSVGRRARLTGSEIEHSIIMEHAELLNVGTRLETSIVGRGASIVRRFEMPRAVRISVGDAAEIVLS